MAGIEHSTKPELREPFPDTPAIWTCPITGLKVPKGYAANLQYRARILEMAERDVGFQNELLAASAQSVLFWTNTFAFTFKLRDVDATGHARQATSMHAPYITWEIQDKHILAIEEAINEGYDLLTDKSREMGASWNHLLVFEHQFLFRPDSMFLEISRTEEYVDRSDNPKSLFWKHRYIRKWLPHWMLPPINDVTMHFTNLENGSKIDGESANANAASGDRRRAILLDEFAKVEQGFKIRSATADVSSCRLVNSTQAGPGTEYSRWRRSGQIKVFVMPWWEHPEKGRGRHAVQDPITKAWEITSPWLDQEKKRRSQQEIDQEILMKDIDAGSMFFDTKPINEHITLFAKPPVFTRDIDFRQGVSQDAIPEIVRRGQHDQVRVAGRGAWRFWIPNTGRRPDQQRNYVFGIDISKGQGASNSVISVLCAETREKVAEYADANTPPYDLARIAVAAAIWFGGTRGRPLVIWEMNGPGWDFGRVLVKKYKYPNYYIDRATGTVSEKRGKKYGWHSSREKKEQLLGMLRRAYAHGGFFNHSAEALEEALTYVYFSDGSLGPAGLVAENASARLTHGDRVVADALTLLGVEDAPHKVPTGPPTPMRSMGARRKLALAKKKVRGVQWGDRIDLSSGTPTVQRRIAHAHK